MRKHLFAVTFLLPMGILASAHAQTINTVAGGFNPSAATSENQCAPLFAAAPHGTDVYVISCNQIYKVTSGTWTLIAGNGVVGFSGDGGPATSASLARPRNLAVDNSGNVYFIDGGLPLCDTGSSCSAGPRIREVVALTGNIRTIAGTGVLGFSGDGGPATAAEIFPVAQSGIATDAAGNVFFADSNNSRIREIVAATGIIQTVAGNGQRGYNGDGGPATLAKLNRPRGIFVDSSDNIFIADTNNERVREVAGGIITTIAGTGTAGFGGDGGPATSAELNTPSGVVAFVSGVLEYVAVADTSNHRIRLFTPGVGSITTVAGNGSTSLSNCTSSLDTCIGDGGPATSGIVRSPLDVSVDSSLNLFVSGAFGSRVIQEVIAGSNVIETFASNGAIGFGGDGGLATNAQLSFPGDAVTDSAGNIYIADQFTGTIRKVTAATGVITTVAGPGTGPIGDGGLATSATIIPLALFVDGSGNIFVADGENEIREISAADGIIRAVAGNAALASGYSGDGGPATSAQLNFPFGVAVDGSGNVIFSDSSNCAIREVFAGTGVIQTIAGMGPSACGFGGDGGPANKAKLNLPAGVFVDAFGDLFIADENNGVIREIIRGKIQTVAGTPSQFAFGGDGGPATSAGFEDITGVFGDSQGHIFVADDFAENIRMFTVGGNIQTVAGNLIEGFSGDGGAATSAALNSPEGVFVEPSGKLLLIADSANSRVRSVTLPGPGSQPSSTTVSSPKSIATIGESVTFTATVTGSGTPTGTVMFFANGFAFGSGALNGSGQATVTVNTAGASAGTYSITAQYLGDSTFAGSTSTPLVVVLNSSETGDFFGNGKPAYAVFRPSNGTWYVLDSKNPGNLLVQQWGESTDIPVRGDFDGDGKTDFAVWRPSTGQWLIIPSSNPGSQIVQQWGANGDIPVPGDYDGDGKTDFAIWRPSTGQWLIIPSSNPSSQIVQQWGASGDIPVPGDYDGDGKADFAIWRPSTGQWFIIPSSNPGSQIVQQWGAGGDIPVPVDYDGDGKTDMAVWRPSTGAWYVIPSSAPSTSTATQWGMNGDIPIQRPIGQ